MVIVLVCGGLQLSIVIVVVAADAGGSAGCGGLKLSVVVVVLANSGDCAGLWGSAAIYSHCCRCC